MNEVAITKKQNKLNKVFLQLFSSGLMPVKDGKEK
jgi:hypothetical protein